MSLPRYSVIYADPPWAYDDAKCSKDWRGTPYSTLSCEAIAELPVHLLAADDCVLFMWATNPLLPEAFKAIAGWGFEYKTVAFQWVKLNPKAHTPFYGLGRWTRGNTEPCLLAVRGKPERHSKAVHQLIDEAYSLEDAARRHSAKPDAARQKIVELMGDVPRLELFARERAEGWDSTGNDLDGLDVRYLLEVYGKERAA